MKRNQTMKVFSHLPKLCFLLLLCFGAEFSAIAREEISSASLKESQIISDIKAKLNGTVAEKDYALQVDVETDRINLSKETPVAGVRSFNTSNDLPGFERDKALIHPNIDELVGNSTLVVKRIKVGLIMHTKISPSEIDYIRQMVPIVANLDFDRGDAFNFIPITPDKEEVGEDIKEVPEEFGEELPLAEPFQEDIPEEKKGFLDFIKENPWFLFLIPLFLILIGALIYLLLSRKEKVQPASPTPSMEENFQALKEQQQKETEKTAETVILNEKNRKMNREIIADLLGDEKLAESLVEDLFKDKKGKNKLASMISIFGESVAEKVFSKYLPIDTYLDLVNQSGKLNITPDQEEKTLSDVQTLLYSKKLSSGAIEEAQPFKFLDGLSPNQIGYLIKDEKPNIKAVILGRMDSDDAASIIKKLSPAERAEVIAGFGRMDEMPLELVKNIAYGLAGKALELPDDKTVSMDGIKTLADVIGFADPKTRESMINDMRTSNQKLSMEVEKLLFVFDSFPVVPPGIIAQVVRKFPIDDVITAIAGSSRELKQAVVMAFPENVRPIMVSKLKALSPLPKDKEIIDKQKLIVAEMQKLADKGKINLREINAAWLNRRGKTNNQRKAS